MLGALSIPIGLFCTSTVNWNGNQGCGSQAAVLPWGKRKTARFTQCLQKRMLIWGRWRSDELFEICIWSVFVVQEKTCRPLCLLWEPPERNRGIRLKSILEDLKQDGIQEELLSFWQNWKPELAQSSKACVATGNLWGEGTLDEVKAPKDVSQVYRSLLLENCLKNSDRPQGDGLATSFPGEVSPCLCILGVSCLKFNCPPSFLSASSLLSCAPVWLTQLNNVV